MRICINTPHFTLQNNVVMHNNMFTAFSLTIAFLEKVRYFSLTSSVEQDHVEILSIHEMKKLGLSFEMEVNIYFKTLIKERN